eukprot:14532524-Alexandrium_andersonii.AAC.1
MVRAHPNSGRPASSTRTEAAISVYAGVTDATEFHLVRQRDSSRGNGSGLVKVHTREVCARHLGPSVEEH